jgi:glycosyltransferase involved in cell wall biosynthesis
MRIAVYHNLPSGGAHRILHGLCRYLSTTHQVDTFTLTTSDQDLLRDADVAHGVETVSYAPRRPIRRGLYLNDLRRLLDLGTLARLGRDVAARIDAGGYDVVFVEACQYTFAPAVLRHVKTPAAFYYNGSPPWLEGPAWRPPPPPRAAPLRLALLPTGALLESKLRRDDKRNVRSAVAVLANSRHSQERVQRAYLVPARLCPPGVSLWPVRPRTDGGYVLSVGAIENRKGFDFVVDALAVLDRHIRPRLVIAANASDPVVRERLEVRASESGVALEIEVNLTDEPLSLLYSGASAFVYGSHDEPLGMAPLEAMAHGLPVVAVAEGGVAETVIDGVTGFLAPRNAEAFAALLKTVLTGAALRHALGLAGRQEAERRWTWETRGRVYERELERLVANA